MYSVIEIDENNKMKLLVTDCTKQIPIALDGVHEDNGSKVNDTTSSIVNEAIRTNLIFLRRDFK